MHVASLRWLVRALMCLVPLFVLAACAPSAVCATSADCAPGFLCLRSGGSGAHTDAGTLDSGVVLDAGTHLADAGALDAGTTLDAGIPPDAGAPLDAGPGRGFVVDAQVAVGARTLQGSSHAMLGAVVTQQPARTLHGTTHTMQVHLP